MSDIILYLNLIKNCILNECNNRDYPFLKGGETVFDRKKAKAQKIIPIEGSILQIEESETEDFVYVLSRKDETCTVTILEGTNTIAASFSFAAHNAFIQTKGSALFVGKDSKISRIDVSRS